MPHRHQGVGINQIQIDANILVIPIEMVVLLALPNYFYYWCKKNKIIPRIPPL